MLVETMDSESGYQFIRMLQNWYKNGVRESYKKEADRPEARGLRLANRSVLLTAAEPWG